MSLALQQYRFITQLAKKKLSHTYVAHIENTSMARVVVKVFDGIILEQEQQRQEFLQEITNLRLLRHPHTVPILDTGIQEQHPYLVSSYMPNRSLRIRLDQLLPAKLALDEALSVLVNIGLALANAHTYNIVHGNVKPENILLNADKEALLADFKLASLVALSSPHAGSDIRTSCYMAPEQFDGQVTKASDQYAFGCIAYELLTGRVPFIAGTVSLRREKHKNDRPEPLTHFAKEIPKHMELAVLKAMAKKPEERFAEVADFVEALLSGSPEYDTLESFSPDCESQIQTIPVMARAKVTPVLLQYPQSGSSNREHSAGTKLQSGSRINPNRSSDFVLGENIWLPAHQTGGVHEAVMEKEAVYQASTIHLMEKPASLADVAGCVVREDDKKAQRSAHVLGMLCLNSKNILGIGVTMLCLFVLCLSLIIFNTVKPQIQVWPNLLQDNPTVSASNAHTPISNPSITSGTQPLLPGSHYPNAGTLGANQTPGAKGTTNKPHPGATTTTNGGGTQPQPTVTTAPQPTTAPDPTATTAVPTPSPTSIVTPTATTVPGVSPTP